MHLRDINFERHRMQINRAAVEAKGRIVVGAPKNCPLGATKRARDPSDSAILGPSHVTAVGGDGGNRTPVHC